MSTLLKPRLSRWGRSVYEQEHHIASERDLLAPYVEVVEDHADAEVIVVHSKQRVGKAELSKCTHVKMVITTTSGFDHLDWSWMRTQGILPVRMPMLRRDAVVESILAMLLHANRRQEQFQRDASCGKWTRGQLATYSPLRLQDQNIAVVGLGVIGQQLSKVLHFLGASVYGVDPCGIPEGLPFVKETSFDSLPTHVDVTLLTCTLNPTSANMVNQAWLSQCRGMTLINCARGKLVDIERTLLALSQGNLSFLGLDVFPEEPYSQLASINEHKNLLFTPHAAGYHPHLGTQIQQGLVDIISRWVSNQSIPYIVE